MQRRYASPPCSMPEIETGPHTLAWKRVYDLPAPDDGLRVFIDRLWPRGIRKEDLPYDAWWKDLAPGTELRQWFDHDAARWDEFRARYAAELARQPYALAKLREALKHSPVTLLSATRADRPNHAAALLQIVA